MGRRKEVMSLRQESQEGPSRACIMRRKALEFRAYGRRCSGGVLRLGRQPVRCLTRSMGNIGKDW